MFFWYTRKLQECVWQKPMESNEAASLVMDGDFFVDICSWSSFCFAGSGWWRKMEEQNRSRGRGDSGSSCRLGLWARFREHRVRREGCWREDFWVLLCSRQVFLAHHFLHKVHQICKLPFSWLFMQVSEGGVVRQDDRAVYGSHLHLQGPEPSSGHGYCWVSCMQ